MSALSTAAYASTYVNNEDVTSSVFTSSSNGYTLFPVRYLGEKLGCDVYWNPDDKCITVSKDDIHRDFYNGSAVVYDWNGNSYNLVTAPKLVDGNTMVPAEFYRDQFGISPAYIREFMWETFEAEFYRDQFGISVIWDDVTSSLFINSEDTYNWLVNTSDYKKTAKNQKFVQHAKAELGVPSDLNVTYKMSDSYYWSAGGVYLTSINFYVGDKLVAGAAFDSDTWNSVRDILMYSGN